MAMFPCAGATCVLLLRAVFGHVTPLLAFEAAEWFFLVLVWVEFTVVMHQTCLVLWTWRKLADETNAKNAPKIC